MAVDDLIEKIQAAFAEVVYPGEENLTEGTYGDEPAALIEEFRDKTDWRILQPAFLDQAPDSWSSALSFFSDRALQFYLPAYLIADLRGKLKTADPGFVLCWGVTPMAAAKKIAKAFGGGTIGEYTISRFAPLESDQISAIIYYLSWKLETLGGFDPIIEQAMEHYWRVRDAVGGHGISQFSTYCIAKPS